VQVDGQTRYDSDAGIHLPPEKRQVGVVFQDYALFPHLDVRANVGFGLSRLPSGERRQRVGEALELLRIGPLASSGREPRPLTSEGSVSARSVKSGLPSHVIRCAHS
jgi:iron(III) transport system ATP-binding protein